MLYKDRLTLLRSFRIYVIMCVGFIILGSIHPDNAFWATYGLFFFSTIIPSLMAVDEQTGWLSYCDILPLKRKTIISERYLVHIITSAGMILFYLVLNLILRKAETAAVLATTGMSLAMSMLVFSVSFPINVKFGHVKGQMVRMAVIMVMVLCGMAIINYGGPILGILIKSGPMILPAGAALVILIYFCSWMLSVRIYEKKDL
ncbi:MAG: ABC-2 transporter permease [Solobacterium sp.]|nr:ABC-2 transporter permease [Solobacterium sp.]